MATLWIEPNKDDVSVFMSSSVVGVAQTDEQTVPKILAAVVQRIRGTIIAGGMTPPSKKATEVPPEAVQHALVLTVFALVASKPNFQFVTADSFEKQRLAAEKWLDAVAAGRPVTFPKDISPDEPRSLVRYGSESEEADMTTD
jgi:hypothetical protein